MEFKFKVTLLNKKKAAARSHDLGEFENV